MRGGFTVQMVTPIELYVTWYTPRRKKERVREVEDEVEFPTLMNLKKIANKYRKNA